jgi:hypothetical protein
MHPSATDICFRTLSRHLSRQRRGLRSVKALRVAGNQAIRVECIAVAYREGGRDWWKRSLLIFYSLLCSYIFLPLLSLSLPPVSFFCMIPTFLRCFLGDEIEAAWYARLPYCLSPVYFQSLIIKWFSWCNNSLSVHSAVGTLTERWFIAEYWCFVYQFHATKFLKS